METKNTREPQYKALLDIKEKKGLTQLGLMTNQTWNDDPKRLLFLLSRYKFVAKMLAGQKRALEVGCGDAFGSRIVLQNVESLQVIDFDPIFIEDIADRMDDKWKFDYLTHDIVSGPVPGEFNAAYALDVLEHIPKQYEEKFLANITSSLTSDGVLIIGTPSLYSQEHASPASKEGHVNCKTDAELMRLMKTYFHNVFIFSMNDEVVHTGFYPMAHYLFAMGAGKKTG